MSKFLSRLEGLKATQEIANQRKQEGPETAGPKPEQEGQRGELRAERDRVHIELARAGKSAEEASHAIEQANLFITEQGDNIDSEVRAQIESLKTEASAALES